MLSSCRRNGCSARCGHLHSPRAVHFSQPLAVGMGELRCAAPCQQSVGGALLRATETLAPRAWGAADSVWVALHQCQQDAIGFIGRQLGVDAVGESLHGLASGFGPLAVEFTGITPDALEFCL